MAAMSDSSSAAVTVAIRVRADRSRRGLRATVTMNDGGCDWSIESEWL